MKTKYFIQKHSDANDMSTTIFETKNFDKDLLQKVFDDNVQALKEGETLEYSKADSKCFYPGMLIVENIKGKIYTFTATGRKKLYNVQISGLPV